MLLTIDAMTSVGPRRFSDQPDFLEISDRLNVNARATGKLAYGQIGHQEIS